MEELAARVSIRRRAPPAHRGRSDRVMEPEQGTELQPHVALSSSMSALEAAGGQLRSAVQQAQAALAAHSGPVVHKAGAVARVAIRTGKEVRRAVRAGAGEIGEVVAGETGREVGSYAATVGLSWLCCGLLPFDDEGIPLDDDTKGA
jgi:hypothetical protein